MIPFILTDNLTLTNDVKFPSMPRHNFAKIEPRVKALCKKHNVPYHCTGFLAGTKEILVRLSELAAMVQRVKVE